MNASDFDGSGAASAVAGRRVLIAVGGGIAAYKVVEVARTLTELGAEVRTVMTEAATRFVGPATFAALTGHSVATDLFPDPSPPEIAHTSLGRWAEVVCVAPATADLMAKMAYGLAGDIVTATLLATAAPVVLAPAMHTEMWEHPATRAAVEILTGRGAVTVGPDEGRLAGAGSGPGRMAEAGEIVAAVASRLRTTEELAGRTVLVTAGGTREPIDPVRFIGNRSSGKMGYALAAEASRRGAKVILVTGPASIHPPPGVDLVRVETSAAMAEAVWSSAGGADAVVMAAAVSDWRPPRPSPLKLKRAAGPPVVDLEPAPDILGGLAARVSSGAVIVAFAAETHDLEAAARAKLAANKADLLVANLVGAEGAGFESDYNAGLLLWRDGRMEEMPVMTKAAMAARIVDALAALLPAR